MRPVAVVGSLTRDVVDGRPPRAGGAPFYAARALARLGVPAVLVIRCAPADERTLLEPLRALGVPVETVAGQTTPAFSFHYRGDERVMTVDAVGEPWLPDDVPRLLAGAAAVHVGALFHGEFPAETLHALGRGRLLSLDGQGLVRAPRVGPLRFEPAPETSLLAHVDVLKLADEEARALVGEADPAAVARLGVREVLVTRGTRGARLFADGRTHDVEPPVVVEGVDPTGAGDAFATTYLVARANGADALDAARRAAELVVDLLQDGGSRLKMSTEPPGHAPPTRRREASS